MMRILVAIAVAVVLGTSAYWYGRSATATATPVLSRAERGDLVVKITEPGDVKASESVTVLSRKDGPVAYVVPEGTHVKAGDVVVRFDSTQQEAALSAGKVELLSAHSQLLKAEKDVEAQKQKLQADLAKLTADYRVAEVEVFDLKKKPARDELEKARLELDKAKATFEHAENKRKLLPELVQKGFVTQSTLDEAELNYLSAKAGLQVAQFNLAKIAAGATAEELEKATIKLTQTKVALEKAQASLKPQLEALAAGVEKHRADVKRAENLIAKARDDLERTQLRAPQAGLAIYGTKGGGSEKIHPGMMTWAGEALITLPDMSVMIVDTEVNEMDIGKVRLRAPVDIRLEAYPGALFHGQVVRIGTVARVKKSRAGAATSIKVFDVGIRIEEKDPRVKPGLTAIVDIIVDRLEGVVSVPVAAVVTRAGDPVVLVASAGKIEERRIVLGPSNDQRVMVKEGLHEGEQVVVEASAASRR
jgi:HlyD family secretion protein